jgi:hypothetical protein
MLHCREPPLWAMSGRLLAPFLFSRVEVKMNRGEGKTLVVDRVARRSKV